MFFIAVLTHYSAVVAIIIYTIIYINSNFKYEKSKKFLNLLIIGVVIFFVFGIDKISLILPRYAISTFSFLSVLKKFFWIFMSYILINRMKKDGKDYNLQYSCFILLIIDLIMFFLSIKVGTFGRISYYFLYVVYFIMIPKLSSVFKQKSIISFLITIVLIVFWYNMTVINYSTDKTYPYKSDIIQFLNDEEEKNFFNEGKTLW